MIGLDTMETIGNFKFQSTIVTMIFLNAEQVCQTIDLTVAWVGALCKNSLWETKEN